LVYIFVSARYPRLLDRLFASRLRLDADDEDFFGAFAVDPLRPAAEIEAAYGAELRPEERAMTISQLLAARLDGYLEYADRVSLGPIDLIVRDVDDDGNVVSVGLSLEPQPAASSMPLLLTAGELRDRAIWLLRALWGAPAVHRRQEPEAHEPDAAPARESAPGDPS